MRIAILILGAGSSTRMDTAKQLLPVGNTTLLGVTIETALQSKGHDVSCVIGANAMAVKQSIEHYKITTILNPKFREGISSSIVKGVAHLQTMDFDSILIMLGDQPYINSDYLNAVIDMSHKHKKSIIASKYNELLGVPAVFPRTYFKKLLLLQGDTGAKKILNDKTNDIVVMPPAQLGDIDTPEDYLQLLKNS